MSVRTTKKQFALFEKECRKWLDKLGLKGWCVEVLHADIESGSTVGQCAWHSTNRCATILFNRRLEDSPSAAAIKRFALHECLELMLSGCTDLLWDAAPRGVVERETHMVIRTLENVLLGSPR